MNIGEATDIESQKENEGAIRYCSFCDKPSRGVRRIIQGPSVAICEECISLCNGILFQNSRRKYLARLFTSSHWVDQGRRLKSSPKFLDGCQCK